ncbi:MAG: tubulin/FtsZ family protein [Haloferacaceae archaeon]
MKLALIGVGQAGGKVVEAFLEYDSATGGRTVTSVTVFNTAEADLRGLSQVPRERRVLVGESRVNGHGVGADNELGVEIAASEKHEILNATHDVPMGETDAFLVVGALGGGTGSGAGPVIARHLKEVYTVPVYGLGILPSTDEGGIYSLNAARSFRTFVGEVDNLLLFDNDAWRRSGESLSEGYREINEELVRRFGVLFSAGEVRPGETVGESVVDASEIINTLAAGGVSTVGYASERIETGSESLLRRFLRSDGEDREGSGAANTRRTTSLVRQATLGRLTLPCTVQSASRALLLVSGPPSALDRKGIEQARRWLEEETGTVEVRGGDYPVSDTNHVAAVVLLSGVTDVPRIREMQAVATETQDFLSERDETQKRELDDLLAGDRDDLDPLF